MKYLSQYIQAPQTALFNKTGAFFAFSKQQYEEGAKEGVKYTNLGSGLICPEANAVELVAGLEEILKNGIAQDLAENGKQGVIARELANHEAYYTRSIGDTCDALAGYGISREEIQAEYNRIAPTVDY